MSVKILETKTIKSIVFLNAILNLWIIISGCAADWATEESWFDSWQEKKFSLFEKDQTGCGTSPGS